MRAALRAALIAAAGASQPLSPAQTSRPATTAASDAARGPAANGRELPADLLQELQDVEDFGFRFDFNGYYELLRYMKSGPPAPGYAEAVLPVTDWRGFLERPSDFRGRPVQITGVVGRNKAPYTHAAHPELGPVWQVELQRPGQPLTATVIFTNDASDLPIGATVELTGYFVMIRKYHGDSGREFHAALLVSPGPTTISKAAPRSSEPESVQWTWIIAGVALGMFFVYWVLRRSARAGSPGGGDLHALSARHAAPLHLADELAEWAAQDAPDAVNPELQEGVAGGQHVPNQPGAEDRTDRADPPT